MNNHKEDTNRYEQLEVVDDPDAPLLNDGEETPRPLTLKQERVSRAQFLAACGALFLIGWGDGSTGPLLPRIHDFYDVGFQKLSWLFVLMFSGSVTGALLNMPVGDRLGLGKMLVLGAGLQVVALTLQSLQLPFPLFVASFAISGMGLSIQDAQANGYIAVVRHQGTEKMGLLHAAYGAGALAAPLVATQFAQMKHWTLHYAVSLLLALTNTVSLALVFKFKDQNDSLVRGGELVPEKIEEEGGSKYSQLLRLKSVHLMTLFLMIYIGVEVTIGGWIVTIMVFERGGGPSTGYISSGFFGGLTLGRVILIPVTKMLGEVRATFIYTGLAILLQLVVWFVPSIVVDGIAISLVGMLLGPMYPIAMSQTGRIIPRTFVTGAIGWMTACGAAGAAVLPFVTGMVAGKLGVGSLQPLLVAMMIIMGALWAAVPKE